MISSRSVIALFKDVDSAADALDAVRAGGFERHEYEILTGTPYPEGAFGEDEAHHGLYRYPLIGAACGFIIGLIITAGTQLAYPLVTGGKPILSVPPMSIIMYEGTMLGAIIFTVIGVIIESRLPRIFMGAYDTRVTEGYIGLTVTTSEGKISKAEEILKKTKPEDIKRGWEQTDFD
jgi:hypothetical protein